MRYKYETIRHNSDATTDFNITGVFPVRFRDFFGWVREHETSFRIEFGASNECYGGWLGNRIEISKDNDSGRCYWSGQTPANWYDEIADKMVTKCWANGGWGQMLYVCTFEE